MATRKLTVIIPSRNSANLRQCVAAVRTHEPDVDIAVIDDGLFDHHGLESCRIYPGMKPFVFARNVNIGIEAECDNDVVLLNDDALLETPLGFTILQRVAYEEHGMGLVAPGVRGPSNSREHVPQSSASVRVLRGFTIPFICVFIPRSTIQTVGLLDERFDCYGGDDDDYCYRIRKAGLKIGVFDGCVVNHGKLQSTFRPHGQGLPIDDARRIFRQIHGFEMATR